MEESTHRSSISDMQLTLQSCQDACRSLQEGIAALEDNLRHNQRILDSRKNDLRIFDDGLMKCIKDKKAVAAKCAKLENEMIKLTTPDEQSAKTRKRASEFASFKQDMDSMVSRKDLKKSKLSRGKQHQA